MEMKRIAAAGILSGAALAAGIYLLHDGLTLEAANARIAGCAEQSQAHNPACANVVAEPNSLWRQGSLDTAESHDELEQIAGVGLLVLGGAGILYTGYKALQ